MRDPPEYLGHAAAPPAQFVSPAPQLARTHPAGGSRCLIHRVSRRGSTKQLCCDGAFE